MRHRRAGKKLGRDTSHRRAVLRNLATSLFRYEEISTTYAKAKALRPIAERMITLAKRGDLHARRQALSYMMDKSVTHKLFDQMRDRFLDRQGGYIRILRAGHRTGDNAPVAIIQLLLAEKVKDSAKAQKAGAKGGKKVSKKVPEKKKRAQSEAKPSESGKESPEGKKRVEAQQESPKTKEKASEDKQEKAEKQ